MFFRRFILAVSLISLFIFAPATPASATTDDASGCNLKTCIYVASGGGSGPDIVEIQVSTKSSVPYQCAIASLYINGNLVVTDSAGCAQGFVHYFSSPWVPHTYNRGDRICVKGSWGNGKPCETVG